MFAFHGVALGLPLLILAIVLGLITPVPMLALVLIAVLAAAYLTFRRYNSVDEVLLDELDVVDADETKHAGAYNLLESLSLSSGVPAPELYLTDEKSVNALAIQQSKDAAAVITAGAVEKLDRLQLEGLLAETIARIASDDARIATVATGMLMPFLQGPGSFLAPFATSILDRVLASDRELVGDIAAVGLTKYPPGLRDALSQADTTTAAGSAAMARLWVVPPAPHTPRYDLDVRLAALNEF